MAQIGYAYGLWVLVGICVTLFPLGFLGMDRCVRVREQRLSFVSAEPGESR